MQSPWRPEFRPAGSGNQRHFEGSYGHRGFHLVRPRTDEEALQTVAAFKELHPDYIVPMHCTGEIFIEETLRQMPHKIVRPYVGTRFVMA